MKKYLLKQSTLYLVPFVIFFALLILSCDFNKPLDQNHYSSSSTTNKPLIGIQKKPETDGRFIHKRDSYDFSSGDWIFEIKENDNKDAGDGVVFDIMDSKKGLDKSNEHNISPYRGVRIIISNSSDGSFENAMTSGGTFNAVLNISQNNEINMKVEKEENENDYVFLDTKITTNEKDSEGKLVKNNNGSLKNEEVSFALNIEKIKEELKKIEKLLKKE